MSDYICHDPDCTDTVSWHLANGDLACIGDNREAVATFAQAAEALKEAVAVYVAATPDPDDHLVTAFGAYETAN
jgi:hypothetical protein